MPKFVAVPESVPHVKPCKHCSSMCGIDPETEDILTWPREQQIETVFPCGWNGIRYCRGYCDKLEITPDELTAVHNRRYGVEV